MRPSKKKLLSMLLCVTLVLSLNARTAFAEAGGDRQRFQGRIVRTPHGA